MNLIKKTKHLWNRIRLSLDSNYYPDYLRNQGVRIGRGTVIVYPSYVDARLPYLVEIGKEVVISRNVTILTDEAATAFAGDMIKVGRVTIGDHCYVGANTTILCNVTIGENCIIRAGSVVTHDLPANAVYAGNPIRFVCPTEEFIQTNHLADSERIFLKAHLSKTLDYYCACISRTVESANLVTDFRNRGLI